MKDIRGRRLWTVVVSAGALGLLSVVAMSSLAGAEAPVKVRAGNVELIANGGFSPKALSKTKFTPIAFNVEAHIKTIDGTHPPALREFNVETDKNGTIDVEGYPKCKSGQLQSTDTKAALKACKAALIGEGKTDVSIAFPEQPPIPVKSDLLAFNGGVKGGVTTLFVHAYITVPTPAAIVTTVKVKKISKGRYGYYAESTIPKIAGGSGSPTFFKLKIDKKFTYQGKKKSVLSAKCPDGKLQARGEAVFADGTRAKAEVLRTCTPKP